LSQPVPPPLAANLKRGATLTDEDKNDEISIDIEGLRAAGLTPAEIEEQAQILRDMKRRNREAASSSKQSLNSSAGMSSSHHSAPSQQKQYQQVAPQSVELPAAVKIKPPKPPPQTLPFSIPAPGVKRQPDTSLFILTTCCGGRPIGGDLVQGELVEGEGEQGRFVYCYGCKSQLIIIKDDNSAGLVSCPQCWTISPVAG